MIFRYLLLMFLFYVGTGTLCAQTKIQGVLIDSTHNNILRNVSVSVYEKGKTTVEKVALTDDYGKFVLEDVVAGKPILIAFSYVGYQKIVREFMLKQHEKKDFGHIHMPFVATEIEAVEVMPPVRMNGDTLEFNADAFQLDTNAVVEDLLRKLPGLVVWGDGAVTYNGREIPNVLVNGKPFFGNDMSIALQNIQKDAVKKIQVYDRRSQEKQREDPDDKKYEMNIVLKDGREKMYFGNAGAGVGTDNRYLGQLNFNLSTGKSQSTVAYSINNVNKNLNSIDQLLQNTTYKGVGINADFDSDFLRSGILNQHVLGARYQYDALGTNEVGKQNIFKADITTRWDKTANTNESSTQLLDAADGQRNAREFRSGAEAHNAIRNASANYNNTVGQIGKRPISIRTTLSLNNYENENVSNTLTENYLVNNRSSNELLNTNHSRVNGADVIANFELYSKAGRGMTIHNSKEYSFWDQVTYTVGMRANVSQSQNDNTQKGDYIDYNDAALNRLHNRNYDESKDSRHLRIDLKIREPKLGFTLSNNLIFYGTTTDNTVLDKDGTNASPNTSLSHMSDYKQVRYEPTIEYQRNLWNKNLYGRAYSNLNLQTELGMRFYRDANTSTLDYRNLNLTYNTFLPLLGLNYTHSKQNSFYSSVSLNYRYNEEYPSLDRMRPIYDDINPAYRYYGTDKLLDKTGIHQVSLTGNYNQQRQYGYTFRFNLSYHNYRQGLTDSIVYAEKQQQAYVVQIKEPMDIYSGNFNIGKPYLIGKDQTLNVRLDGSIGWGNKYQYIGDKLQEMLNNNQNIGLNFYYTVLDKYQVGWTNYLNRYERYNKLDGANSNNYTSYSWNSGLSMSYALTKKWSVNTNATGQYNKSGSFTDDALIWNANTTYRMMKGNNLEIKVAAYDLLRQNKGVYFTNGLTEFTTGYRNILTQYYMLSVSYYPRKFGFKR